jgi:hypothetical protein
VAMDNEAANRNEVSRAVDITVADCLLSLVRR